MLTPAANAYDSAKSAAVCALIVFWAGNRGQRKKYSLQYQKLSCPIGQEGISGLTLYSEFGMQVLSGLGTEDEEGKPGAASAAGLEQGQGHE